ncbi:MAG: hypothetical protein JWN04_3165 [Myxococcaceae bacterium]|nr:hypothetical protein [Myxococcaceae bacterium]
MLAQSMTPLVRLLPCAILLVSACAHQTARPQPAEKAPFCSAEEHHSAEGSLGVSGALAALNARFLETHARARQQRCSYLEHDGLVLRYAFGMLEARLHGVVLQPATNVLPAEYHPIKDVTHALFLAALIVSSPDPAEKHRQTPAAVQAIEAVLAELAQPGSLALKLIAPEHVERQRRILLRSKAALLAQDLAAARGELDQAHDDLEQNLSVVATATVRGIHQAVQKVRTDVERRDKSAWGKVLVVIAVAHQARAEALEVQYFERLLHEPMQEGAHGERRMVIAENLEQPEAQYGLLSMHLVDQLGGRLLFEDRARLQRDVLSGHAAELDRLLPPVSATAPTH